MGRAKTATGETDAQATKATIAVERLNKRLAHETEAQRFEDNARQLERRRDLRGATLMRARAQRERDLAATFK